MDKDKKHLISKEIRSFRDTYKVSYINSNIMVNIFIYTFIFFNNAYKLSATICKCYVKELHTVL